MARPTAGARLADSLSAYRSGGPLRRLFPLATALALSQACLPTILADQASSNPEAAGVRYWTPGWEEAHPSTVRSTLQRVVAHAKAHPPKAASAAASARLKAALACATARLEGTPMPPIEAALFEAPTEAPAPRRVVGAVLAATRSAGLAALRATPRPSLDAATKKALADLIAAVERSQRADGTWGSGTPDLQATGYALFGLAWAIEHPIGMQWLDVHRLVAIRGWRALRRAVDDGGRLRVPSGAADAETLAAWLLGATAAEVFLEAHVRPPDFTRTPTYIAAVEHQSRMLTEAARPDRQRLLALLRLTCDYQHRHLFKGSSGDAKDPDTSWYRGALYAGVAAAWRATRDSHYHTLMLELGRRTGWKPGPNALHDANDLAVSDSHLQIYAEARDEAMLRPTRAVLDELLARNATGQREWSWVDALFMGPPTWAAVSAVTGDRRYVDRMDRCWWEAVDFLYDREAQLFYRDKTYRVQGDGFQLREANGEKIFWGRGNGWLAGGLCRVLHHLPADYPSRSRYEQLLREFAEALRRTQGADGLWRASLLDPDSYPMGETSGSTFFCYALAWGVNHGVLDRATYQSAALAAWRGLAACVDADGRLGYVQLPADSPRSPVYRHTNVEYATGAFLLAGSEILSLLPVQ